MENFRKNVAYRLSLVFVLPVMLVGVIWGGDQLFNRILDIDVVYHRIQLFAIFAYLVELLLLPSLALFILGVILRLIAVLPEQGPISFIRWKDFYFFIFAAGVSSFLRLGMVSLLLFVDPKFLPTPPNPLGLGLPIKPLDYVPVAAHPTLHAREYAAGQILGYMLFTSLVVVFFITISMLISEIKRLKTEKTVSFEENKVL